MNECGEHSAELLVSLQAGSGEEKMRAAKELGELREHSAVPSLFAALTSGDSRLRGIALEALGKFAEPQARFPIQDVSSFLDKYEWFGQFADHPDSSLIPLFIDALGEDATLRFVSGRALGQTAPRDVGDLRSLHAAIVKLKAGNAPGLRSLMRTYANWSACLHWGSAAKYESLRLPPRFRKHMLKPQCRNAICKKEVLRA